MAQLAVGAPALAQGSGAPPTRPEANPDAAGKEAPSAAEDPEPEVLRLYNRGVEAVKLKQWEKARDALLEAFKLQPLPQIAANLGYAEFMGGRFRDAAEHLSFFLRQGQNISEKDREDNEKRLADAKAKIGTVTVQINVAGAKVLMDAHEVGVSPLARPLFVEPGSRVFEAQKDGFVTQRHVIEVERGSDRVMGLTLMPLGPSAQESGSPPRENERAAMEPGVAETAQPLWRGRTVALAAGLAAVGVGLGIGFSVAAARDDSAATKEHDAVAQRTVVGKLVCPMGYEEPRCHKFAELARTRDVYLRVAVPSFVVGGVAAVSAAVAALWWPSKPAPPGHPPTSFRILPSHQGAVVMGSF